MSIERDLRKQKKVELGNTSLPLPDGAATEATLVQVRDYLDTVESKLQSILTELEAQNIYSTDQSTTTVSASTTSVLLKAANQSRKQITIRNASNKRLHVCFFSPATTSTPFFLDKDETLTFDKFTGDIYGIWDATATGDAYITEETI